MREVVAGLFLLISYHSLSQSIPRIESCDCPVPVDSSYQKTCGYLLVPENRSRKLSRTIKLPFIIVHSKDSDKRKDPVLYTSGGPGGSSLRWATRVPNFSIIGNRDCIAFEQRGTRYAIPNLWSNELADAMKLAYRENLDKDSMTLEGVKSYRRALEKKGIDLEGYNTDETVSDIHDLLRLLKIDSINLLGGSYSGGLMMAVLKKDSSRIRSLVLDSPLPVFIPIDEDEPANFLEAIRVLSANAARDSADKHRYGNIEKVFHDYFSSIIDRTFTIEYRERDSIRSTRINYGKNELLLTIVNTLSNAQRISQVPSMITEIAAGHHEPYIREWLDDLFAGNTTPSGMRISVYCGDQAMYHDEAVIRSFHRQYPFMKNFHINDVYNAICDCWKYKPVSPLTKQPFYSAKPVLLGDGEMDPACSPLYIDMIGHYMTNNTRLLFTKRSHGVFGSPAGDRIIKEFLDHPFDKIAVEKDIILIQTGDRR